MPSTQELLDLFLHDPELANACAETAMIIAADEPSVQTDHDTYSALSERAKKFVDNYPKVGSLTPMYCFFEDTYIWGVLRHEDGTAQPCHVGPLGALLIENYIQSQLDQFPT